MDTRQYNQHEADHEGFYFFGQRKMMSPFIGRPPKFAHGRETKCAIQDFWRHLCVLGSKENTTVGKLTVTLPSDNLAMNDRQGKGGGAVPQHPPGHSLAGADRLDRV